MIARHGTAHAESEIHITPDTTVTLWRGEKMDDQLAVEGLLKRDREPNSPEICV